MSKSLVDVNYGLQQRWSATGNVNPRLLSVELSSQSGVRGIRELKAEFKFPVVGVAGPNGCGKSTLLALCACAYHSDGSFIPAGGELRTPYYTFGHFFRMTSAETPHEETVIIWQYAGASQPQIHMISKRKKWSKYEKRPVRPVQFVGLSRSLPPQEKSVLLSHFCGSKPLAGPNFGVENTKVINKILGSSYLQEHISKTVDS